MNYYPPPPTPPQQPMPPQSPMNAYPQHPGKPPMDPQKKKACCLMAAVGGFFLLTAAAFLGYIMFKVVPENMRFEKTFERHIGAFNQIDQRLYKHYEQTGDFEGLYIIENKLYDRYNNHLANLQRSFPVIWSIDSGDNFADIRFEVLPNAQCPATDCTGTYCMICEDDGCYVAIVLDEYPEIKSMNPENISCGKK